MSRNGWSSDDDWVTNGLMLPSKHRVSALLVAAAVSAVAFIFLPLLVSGHVDSGPQSASPPYVTSGKFTASQPSFRADAKEYFEIYPTHVQQPIAFPHKIHVKNGMPCDACHAGVGEGQQAAIPGATVCMTCHQVIATNKPEIKKLAAYYKKGEEVPWQRVYWFYPSSHVDFWHGPHIRAGVECKSCHGDMSKETVAVRKAGLNMGFCVNCHLERHAPTDCTTCHN